MIWLKHVEVILQFTLKQEMDVVDDQRSNKLSASVRELRRAIVSTSQPIADCFSETEVLRLIYMGHVLSALRPAGIGFLVITLLHKLFSPYPPPILND